MVELSEYTPWAPLTPMNKDVLPYGPDGIAFPFSYDYYWVYLSAIIIAFYAACGIGANDVANSFATSVGSGSLSIMTAVIIAGIFEFGGAVLLGASVTDTIKGGLIDQSFFLDDPDVLMIGMYCALISAAFWLTVATVKELPVSTTHSTVGAILGFALCLPDSSIKWSKFFQLIQSWFVTPAIAGAIAALFFFLVRLVILRHENSFERALKFFPVLIFVVISINCWFVIIKGGKAYKWADKLGGYGPAMGVSCGVGAGVAILIQLLLIPRIRSNLKDVTEKDRELTTGKVGDETDVEAIADEADKKRGILGWAARKDANIHEIRNDRVMEIHQNAEKFEYRTELAFGYLQVFTACMMSFAHGANDVANSIGPLAAVMNLYDTNGAGVLDKSPVEKWVLALGGAGIVVGLAVYGHKVIRALGVKLIKITPSRGACIELSTATVIIIGSILKLPLSTTQTMVGASIGLAILEGARSSINFKLFAKIFLGWVLTLVVAGTFSAALFSLVVYSPSLARPLAPQNCMGAYGVEFSTAANLALQANDTVLVGNKATGVFTTIMP